MMINGIACIHGHTGGCRDPQACGRVGYCRSPARPDGPLKLLRTRPGAPGSTANPLPDSGATDRPATGP